ncbi:VOC family protein [Nocardia arthritidis]|nr:VOC family protein [Nocardia arthritidis]
MKVDIGAITLAVRDLDRSLRFYREALGLSSPGIIGTEYIGDQNNPSGATAMFKLPSGQIFSIYSRDDLAKDAGVPPERVAGSGSSLGYFVDSRDDVDRVLENVRKAGGTIVRAPLERPWGIYAGYFGDPDGHLWEVVYFLHGRPN